MASQWIANMRYLTLAQHALNAWSIEQTEDQHRMQQIVHKARERALLYDDLISASHLVDGMVVGRKTSGEMIDECDSLLFSSLRFAALKKLGFEDRAVSAWQAIVDSRQDGRWRRHPRCEDPDISRDMLFGVLIALSQKPQNYQQHLHEIVDTIERSGGYFSSGPVYVSYITPALARLLRRMVEAESGMRQDLPFLLKQGFSTDELTLYSIGGGFEAHLAALNAWLEMEISAPEAAGNQGSSPYPKSGALSRFLSVGSPQSFDELRIPWNTLQLNRIDKNNLFFRYLRLRSANALTPGVATRLLQELLDSPLFPEQRLPQNCDRKADYVWQRAPGESRLRSKACTEEFSGTDFLWMTGLLVAAIEKDADR
ncbi:hypothetical protein E3A20_04810 [Planctomyces bekefii]|uniref:Uncharacterized protein n=1 Tax=Planctomyces bekefii TaxID=1653850 RepID=A0A5C6M9P5_9PLAN|nr:hypothetical protein E3A20_04810 [Planctomyces bekefii]